MPRLGKKTLYLDLDALEKIQGALQRLPGRPSVSSYLNEQLPVMADVLDQMVTSAQKGGLRGMAEMLGVAARHSDEMLTELETEVTEASTHKNFDKPFTELMADVPPKKPRKARSKKVVEE